MDSMSHLLQPACVVICVHSFVGMRKAVPKQQLDTFYQLYSEYTGLYKYIYPMFDVMQHLRRVMTISK